MNNAAELTREHIAESTKKHRKWNKTLLQRLKNSDKFLAIHQSPAAVDSIADPRERERRRKKAQKQRDEDEESFRTLIQPEQNQ